MEGSFGSCEAIYDAEKAQHHRQSRNEQWKVQHQQPPAPAPVYDHPSEDEVLDELEEDSDELLLKANSTHGAWPTNWYEAMKRPDADKWRSAGQED